jgi:hypothetical protein
VPAALGERGYNRITRAPVRGTRPIRRIVKIIQSAQIFLTELRDRSMFVLDRGGDGRSSIF